MKKVISTAKAPAAIGPYSQAIETSDLIFVSGQLPIGPDGVMPDNIADQTRASLCNIINILEEAGSSADKIVKTTVLLADMNDFAAMNEVYATFFEGDYPARACYAVKALPKAALVEIECIATK